MLTDFFDDYRASIDNILFKLLLIAALLVATWLARLFITRSLPALVRYAMRWSKTNRHEPLVRAVQAPARLLVTTLGLWLAALTLEPSPTLTDLLARTMRTIIAFAIFWALFRLIAPMFDIGWAITHRTRGETQLSPLMAQKFQSVIEQIGKALVVLITLAVIIDLWGFDIAGLVAGLGIGGLAVALAAQDTLANLFGYFMILADQPFNIGEVIVFNNITGNVEGVGFRSTRIRALDQSLITVPNSTVVNASITNWSRLSKRRLNTTLGLEYGHDPSRVLSVVQAIREMLQNHELVQRDSVIVQFVEFGQNALQIMMICFITTPDWGEFQATKQNINLRIMGILQEHGVSLAFPSHTVFIEETPPMASPPRRPQKPVVPPKPEPTGRTAADSPVPPDAPN